MKHTLTVRGLTKEYATPAEPLVVLRGVDLEVGTDGGGGGGGGGGVAIVGPSGSGKSTLLNILGTLDVPTAGTVELDGVNPFSLDEWKLAGFRSERVGFVFQDHHLLPQCTALENVLLAALARGKVGSAETARGRELLEAVGLTARATHLPAELSGGERQRVALARALMNRPTLLLCDEPTGNLDPKTSVGMGELLAKMAGESGAILIVVTHSAALAATFGRRLRMTDGRLVAEA